MAAVCPFPSVEAAVDTVVATIQAGIPIARIELLDDATMARLNASVDVDKKTVEDVARTFLKEQGLV